MSAPSGTPRDAASAHPSVGAGVLMIVSTLACWTVVPPLLRYFSESIDGWTANGWRYGFSALMWLPVLLWTIHRRTFRHELWRAAIWPSVFNTGAQVCFGLAPYYIDPGLMTFCLRTQIVFLTLGAVLLFPAERAVIRSPGFLLGIGMVLLGTVLVLTLREPGAAAAISAAGTPPSPDNALATHVRTPNLPLGVALAIGSGVLYAAYALSVRRCMHKLPAFTAFSVVSLYTGVALVLAMLVLGDRAGATALDLSGTQFGALLLSAVVGIGIGHTLYYASITRLGLAVAAGVVQLQPVTVSIVSMFAFGELLTPAQWISGILAIAGATVMLVTQSRARERAQAAAKTENHRDSEAQREESRG